ncbi:MAG: hypothetical protein ACM31C_17680 [Acidobacteriota bacterium]
MTTIPNPAWRHVGKTSNADFYEIDADILAIVPFADSRDDETSARESIAFQDRHWRAAGHRGAVIVFMDNVIEQDAGARGVYAEETSHTLTTCYALVGETFFGHAAGAVFTGLARPTPPTQVFRSVAEARPWIAAQNRARAGRT